MAPTAVRRESLTYDEARARVLAAVRPLAPETLPLERARGRALRTDVAAPHALPPFRNSSMDGFAVRAADLATAAEERPVEVSVTGAIPAGTPAPRPLLAGEAMRIMTGAMMPDGADAVVPFELAGASSSDFARFTAPVAPGANVRAAGADVTEGETVLRAGRDLSPHDLALLGALGIPRVDVGRRPRAIVLSTGDELLAIDAPLRPGAIRDSNSLQLSLLLEEAGAEVVRTKRLRDDPAAVLSALRSARAEADVTLTVGGVSVGDHDPVRASLAELGGVEWWRVAMKPGQPQAFGATGSRLFFGLPGNPASVACVFEALVRPALRALQGFAVLDRPRLSVHAAERIESRPGRTDFVRARLERREDGWWASPSGEQISGHLGPQSRADVLIQVPAEVEVLERGATAEALLMRPDALSGRHGA